MVGCAGGVSGRLHGRLRWLVLHLLLLHDDYLFILLATAVAAADNDANDYDDWTQDKKNDEADRSTGGCTGIRT